MKKSICLWIIVCLLAGLCACSGQDVDRVPDFEEQQIAWVSASAMLKGETSAYRTICEKDPAVVTEGIVDVTCEPCDAPQGFKTPDGYVWQKLRMRITFGDEAANENGYRYCYFMTDYYDVSLLASSISFDDSRQCDTFTVQFNNKKYKRCVAMISKASEDWEMDEESGLQHCGEILTWTLCLPEGYDGICCCLYDASLQEQLEGSKDFTAVYDAPSFVMVRLDCM